MQAFVAGANTGHGRWEGKWCDSFGEAAGQARRWSLDEGVYSVWVDVYDTSPPRVDEEGSVVTGEVRLVGTVDDV